MSTEQSSDAGMTLEQVAAAADAEAVDVRHRLERVAAGNARLARALHVARGGETTDPRPFDLAPLYEIAARETGTSIAELQAMAAELQPDAPPSPPDPRVVARGRAKRVGVPELHIRHVVDRDPERGEALEAVEAFMGNNALGFLILSGGKGTHKTGSACWALAWHGGEYVEAADLLAVAIEDKERYARLRKAALVLLDDLGTETADGQGYWQRTFNTLWNGWYGACAKVIVTTNVSAEQFKTMYGERATDRLRERGRFAYVAGESKRRRPSSAPRSGGTSGG